MCAPRIIKCVVDRKSSQSEANWKACVGAIPWIVGVSLMSLIKVFLGLPLACHQRIECCMHDGLARGSAFMGGDHTILTPAVLCREVRSYAHQFRDLCVPGFFHVGSCTRLLVRRAPHTA